MLLVVYSSNFHETMCKSTKSEDIFFGLYFFIIECAHTKTSVDCFFGKANAVWHQYRYRKTMLRRIFYPCHFHSVAFRRQDDAAFDLPAGLQRIGPYIISVSFFNDFGLLRDNKVVEEVRHLILDDEEIVVKGFRVGVNMRRVFVTMKRDQLSIVSQLESAVDNARRSKHRLDQQRLQRTGNAERIVVVVRDNVVGITMEGQHRDVASMEKGCIGHGAPHIDNASDSKTGPNVVATGIDVAQIGTKEVTMSVFRTGLIGHKGEVERGDGSRTGTTNENHGSVNTIVLLMRNQIAHGRMGILHSTVARPILAIEGRKPMR